MPTNVKLRKLLHRKSWELCTPSIGPSQAVNSGAGSFIVSDKFDLIPNSLAYFVAGTSAIYRYDGDEDSWVQLPNSGLTGTFGAGACGEFRALGAMGGVFTQTATGGTTSTIVTNRTIVRSLAGRKIRVIAGTGVGYEADIVSNTLGANAVLTVPTHSVAFDATTQFQIFSGSLWTYIPGAAGANGFGVYDLATNAWTARATLAAIAWGTDGQLVSTIGALGAFATGTATAGAAATLTNSGKAWLTNMWANYQIRITAGTGAGQIRTIASNTGTVITVSSNWTINPDATSQYSIEGNGDFFYLLGNNAVTLYRFQVSTNTWTTLAPTAARAAALGAGGTASWMNAITGWDSETPSVIQASPEIRRQNGRYIFSFRGGATNALDIYDIAATTWISNVSYGNQFETFTTGSHHCDDGESIYIQKEATGRIMRFNPVSWSMQSFAATPLAQGAAVVGQKMFLLPYSDGGTKINFLYTQAHTSNVLSRILLI
jgi:hypothetical protein